VAAAGATTPARTVSASTIEAMVFMVSSPLLFSDPGDAASSRH
jgi:hypothetical protein